jgi:hypothetical protein
MNVDPLRERDLPDPERMLARILDDSAQDTVEMGIEHLDDPGWRTPRWLQVVAAAALVFAVGGVGWSVTRPDLTGAQPGGRPGPVPAVTPTPTPTPTPEAVPTGSADQPTRVPTTRPPTTTRAPSPTPSRTSTPTPTRAPTPSPTPSRTSTPTPTPSPSPTRQPLMPSVVVVNVVRSGSGESTHLTVNYRVCAGSAPASLRGPLISGVRPNAANGSGAMASPLVDGTVLQPGNCQVFSDTWQTDAQSGRISVHITPSGEPENQWTDYYAASFG